MNDYEHCLTMAQEILPNEDWEEIWEEWHFENLDHGDNEPFALIREAMRKLMLIAEAADEYRKAHAAVCENHDGSDGREILQLVRDRELTEALNEKYAQLCQNLAALKGES